MDFLHQPTDTLKFLRCAKEDGDTTILGAGGTTGAVNVHVSGTGDVVVDYHFDAFDVEASGGDVGGDEDGVRGRRAGEAFQVAETRFLNHVGVQGRGREGKFVEHRRKAFDGGDGVGEDECAAGVAEEEVVEVEILNRGG